MTRLDDAKLPHRITIITPGKAGSEGRAPGTRREDVHALVRPFKGKVRDDRPRSETRGEEVVATSRIVLQPEDYVKPGTRLVIMAGTPAEDEVEVVRAALADVPAAPESAQAWVV